MGDQFNDDMPEAAGVEGRDDISGLVLKDLNEKPDEGFPQSDMDVGSHVPSPGIMEGQDAPKAPEQNVAADTIQAPAGRRARTAQERIAQLTRQRYQERGEKEAILQELAVLKGLVAERQAAPARVVGQAQDSLTEPNAAPVTLTPELIQQQVTKAITDYDAERRAQASQIAALNEAHRASFEEVMAEFPEFGDRRTRARQLFEQIEANSPLRGLPDAPYQIALQALGIMAAETANVRQAPHSPLPAGDRKAQAAIVSPKPSATDLPQAGRAAMQARFAEVNTLRRAGNDDFQTFREWRMLRDKLRNP